MEDPQGFYVRKRKKSVPVTDEELLFMLRSFLLNPSKWTEIVRDMKANIHMLNADTQHLYENGTIKQLRNRLSAKLSGLMSKRLEAIENPNIRNLIQQIRQNERTYIPDNPGPAHPEPINPRPANHEPVNPGRANHEPVDPGKTNSVPVNPGPANAEPVNPEPANPGPANPASASTRSAYPGQANSGSAKQRRVNPISAPKPGLINPRPASAELTHPRPDDARRANPRPGDARPANARPENAEPARHRPEGQANPRPANDEPAIRRPENPGPANPRPANPRAPGQRRQQNIRDAVAQGLSSSTSSDEDRPREQNPGARRRKRPLSEVISESHMEYTRFMKKKMPKILREFGILSSDSE